MLADRIATASAASAEDLIRHLSPPVLIVSGTRDRLLSRNTVADLLTRVPFSVGAEVDAPHLAAQVAPAAVWQAITDEFERAA